MLEWFIDYVCQTADKLKGFIINNRKPFNLIVFSNYNASVNISKFKLSGEMLGKIFPPNWNGFTVLDLSLVTRKPVFRVFDKVRLKPACSAPGTSYNLEISSIASRGIILSRQRTTKALIRLRGRTGWSAPLLFAYGINSFSHEVAHFILTLVIFCIGKHIFRHRCLFLHLL